MNRFFTVLYQGKPGASQQGRMQFVSPFRAPAEISLPPARLICLKESEEAKAPAILSAEDGELPLRWKKSLFHKPKNS
ncbi:MAG: hypothetical protein J5622_05405, partial [Firmicutes bacterium]|nr:hypothetical protein [Bacillota bacterium]